MSTNKMYYELVDNNIEPIDIENPYLGQKNKIFFINKFIEDLMIQPDQYEIIYKSNFAQAVKINFNNQEYKVIIQYVDGGGKDIVENGQKSSAEKKVSIPFANSFFSKCIKNDEIVFLLNIYFPITKKGDNYLFNLNEYFYFIVFPETIYESKGYQLIKSGKKANDSSRWVKLTQLLEFQKSNNVIDTNNAKNVYMIKNSYIKKWFLELNKTFSWNSIIKKKIKEEYIEELKKIKVLDEKSVSAYRNLFRKILILERGLKCEINGCPITHKETLWASHIKSVKDILLEDISTKDKIKQITSVNNGLLLCRNHDSLFDKKIITFNKDSGMILFHNNFLKYIDQFFINKENIHISIDSEETKYYLNDHNIKWKNKILVNKK